MSEMIRNTQPQGKDFISKSVVALSISTSDIVYIVLCYVMSSCTFFDGKTPFVLSAYAASFGGSKWFLFLLSSILGLIRGGIDFSSVMYIMTLGGATFFMGTVKGGRRFKAICVSCLLFTSSLIQNMLSEAYWYDYFISAVEAGLCFGGVYVFEVSVPLLVTADRRKCILDTELVALFILLALTVRCTVNLPLLLGLDISVVLSVLFLLAINMESDISLGTAMGVVFGLVTAGRAVSPVSSIGAFAFASLCSGILNRFGRWGVVLGFIMANAAMTAFFSADTLPFDIFEVMSASIVFAALPRRFTGYISDISSKTVHTATKAFVLEDKMQNIVSKKLMSMSEAYSSLADSYDRCFKSETMSRAYIIHMLDTVSSRICPECGLKYNCWERCYKDSYKAMVQMLETADKKGSLDVADVPNPLKDKCTKITDFVSQFNRMFGIYKVEKMWQDRFNDARKLVSEQLRAVSRSVKNTAIEFDMCLDTAAEKEIKASFDRHKIDFKDVTFLKGRGDSFSMEVLLCNGVCPPKEEKLIETIVEEVTGRCAALVSSMHEKEGLMLTFRDSAKYRVSVGNASISKSGEDISGDSFVSCVSPQGCFVAAISDGMGTGKAASVESITATELLKSFMVSGMDIETSLELINSSLLLRSSGDSFATMDVCSIDLSKGSISLFKSGAATGYVKKGSEVFKIESDSLPFGVLKNYGKISTREFDADKTTQVILMTDGVYDMFAAAQELSIETILRNTRTDNPQTIASELLNKALELSGGKPIDDMTVVALNIWQKKE